MNGFDTKESLLGYFGTSEAPQKASAVVDFVIHVTKLDSDVKQLI